MSIIVKGGLVLSIEACFSKYLHNVCTAMEAGEKSEESEGFKKCGKN
jgi:hypothetical protein